MRMKKSSLADSAIRHTVLLFVLCLCGPLCSAQTTGGEIAELLNKHDDAMNQQNLDAVMVLFSTNPKTVMLGTGPGEKFQGAAEIRAAYTEMFKDYDKGKLTHTCYWKDGRVSGDVAWGAFMCKFADSKGGKNREYELNVSAVAEKEGGKWQFVLLHYSSLYGGGGTTK
jgi:ketosteroid isomerase-like protein